MKKTINLLALFVLVSVNVFTPISYAQSDEAVEIPEPVAIETSIEEEQLPEEVETPVVSEDSVKPQPQSAIDIVSGAVDEYKEIVAQELENTDTPEEEKSEEIGEEVTQSDSDESLNPVQETDEGMVETMGESDPVWSNDNCYEYQVLDEENKQIEIVGYSGNCPKFVDLSDGIDGYNVVSIADNAFRRSNEFTANGFLTGIILGDTVERIGEFAFYDWGGGKFEYVKIGKNVKYIGYRAFDAEYYRNRTHYYTNIEFADGFDYDRLEVDNGEYNNPWFIIRGGENDCFEFDVGGRQIYDYMCEENNVVIPEEIRGFTVNGIFGYGEGGICSWGAFSDKSINNIILPSTVNDIGSWAACPAAECGGSIEVGSLQVQAGSISYPGIQDFIGVKPYRGQELSPELTNEMLSAACMYILEEHVVRFYDENGDLIKQVTVKGYIDEEDYPVVDQRVGFRQLWINQHGEAYDGDVVTEDLMLTLKYKREGIIYENGIIKISDGENEIWLRDRNVGAEISRGIEVQDILDLIYYECNVTYDEEYSNRCQFAEGIDCYDSMAYEHYDCSSGVYEEISRIAGVNITTEEGLKNYINDYVLSFGNYYFRGNNYGVNYKKLELGDYDNYYDGRSIENMSELDSKFLEGGKLGNPEGDGWIEGKPQDNPCDPEKGEYLPTPEDWTKLMTIWANKNGYDLYVRIPDDPVYHSLGISAMDSAGSLDFPGENERTQFLQDMLIPGAGMIFREQILCQEDEESNCDEMYHSNDIVELQTAQDENGYVGDFYGDGLEYDTVEEVRDVWWFDGGNNVAFPVRCFVEIGAVESESHTITFVSNGGNEIDEKVVEDGNPIGDLPMPERDSYIFLGWYDNPDFEGIKFDSSMPIEEDITLYARRGQIIYNDGDITYTDTNGKVFGGMGTITFTDGVNSITMLDRNLGATSTLNDTEGDSNGYYFQWGNNYGFLPGENEIDIERVDVTGYGWNNPYVSNKFIINTGQWNYSELSANNEEEFADGLWGGFGDYRDNTWNSSEGHDYMRQGPCPDGYHVPSGGEWIDLVTMWSDANVTQVSPNDKLAINTSRHSEYYDFLDDFYIPLMGRMDYNVNLQPVAGGDTEETTKENVKLKNNNKFAYARSSSPYYLTADGGYELYGDSRRLAVGPNAKAHGSIERSNGFPVRCFADNYAEGDEPLVLSYDTRGGSPIQAQTIPAGENEYLPGYTTHRTGYELLGWYDDLGELELDGNKITNRTMESDSSENGVVTIYARWNDDHVVTFKDYDGSVIKVVLVKSGANAQAPADPIRNGYKFTGWDKDLNNVTEDMEVIAQYSSSSNGGYSGGGGSSNKPDKSHDSADDKEVSDTKDSPKKEDVQPSQGKTLDTTSPSKETFNAHQWAYSNGLTKYRTASEARMDDPLNRSEMAKISSIFATQFLDKVPNENKKEFCSQYPDLWKVTSDMEAFIIQSCELGYMGYESNGIDALARFRPYTPVTVAEAATILSRIVRGNDNAMNGKDWYKGHLYATYNHGLIDDIKDPTTRSITRREAYLMLYRLIKDK